MDETRQHKIKRHISDNVSTFCSKLCLIVPIKLMVNILKFERKYLEEIICNFTPNDVENSYIFI